MEADIGRYAGGLDLSDAGDVQRYRAADWLLTHKLRALLEELLAACREIIEPRFQSLRPRVARRASRRAALLPRNRRHWTRGHAPIYRNPADAQDARNRRFVEPSAVAGDDLLRAPGVLGDQ